jgi:hypothetical protein
LFEGTGNVVQESANLFWDNTNGRLGIGTSSPSAVVHSVGSVTASSLIARGNYIQPTLVPNANNSQLIGLQVDISASAGGFTNVLGWGLILGNLLDNNLRFQRTIYGTSLRNSINSYTAGTANNSLLLQDISSGTTSIGAGGGNVLINTTTDAGFKLDVNGTARVQDNVTISKNQNATTKINVSNTTAGITSTAEYNLTSDATAGIFNFGKASSTYSPYKIFTSSNGYIYNGTAGDIAILNDVASGRIKFSAGASATAQMTIFNTGNVGINTTTDAGFKLDVNGTARVSATDGATAFQITAPTRAWYFTTSASGGTFNAISGSANGGSGTGNFGYVLGGGWAFHIGTTTSQGNSLLGVYTSGANAGDVRIGGQTSVASSLLTLDSTTKGFLPPRMTTTQKNAIASPAAGLMVYDTTLNVISFYNGTIWL